MTVYLNNQPIEISEGSSLLQFIEQSEITATNIAIAINNKLILKPQWATTTLHDKDNIVVIVAAYGG